MSEARGCMVRNASQITLALLAPSLSFILIQKYFQKKNESHLLNPKKQGSSLLKVSWESSIQGSHEQVFLKPLFTHISPQCPKSDTFLPCCPTAPSVSWLSFSPLSSGIISPTLNFCFFLHFTLLSAWERPPLFFYSSLTWHRSDLWLKRSGD